MSKTIILIHGYGFDHREWLPIEIAFEGFRPLYFSLPGFGSEIPLEPYTIASLAKRFWDSIDPEIHPTVHLAGHSMGGYVCMEMAAQQPSRVESLALIHSHVFEDGAEKKSQRTVTMGNIKTSGRSALVHKMIPSLFADVDTFSVLIDALVLRGMLYDDLAWYYGAEAMRDRVDHGETLRNLSVPVVMIAGNKDNAVPPDIIYQQSHLPAQNTLHMHDGMGHMGMYENPLQIIRDLRTFYLHQEGNNL